MRRSRLLTLFAALAALLLLLSACADDETDEIADEPDEDDAPLALEDDDDDDVPELDDEDEVVDEDDDVVEEDDFDVDAAVAQYASTLPDGWMAIGDPDDFAQAIEVDGTVLIDVREEDEYEEGHIPGAVNIPIRELGDNLEAIPTDQPVLINCQAGWRAGIAVSALRMMGYDNAEGFAQGPDEWEEAGYELVTEFPEPESFGEPDLPEPELADEVGQWLTTLPEGFLATGDPQAIAEAVDAGAAVVDLRGPEDFEEAHVEGAVNIPMRELGDRIDEVPTDVDVVFHCQSGWRCALAMPVLGVHGYTNIIGYPGHFDGLVEQGLTT